MHPRLLVVFLTVLLGFFTGSARAQFTVSGVSDRSTYTDRVTFQITPQAGYSYAAQLNTNTVPIGAPVTVDRMDYYELTITATPTNGGSALSSLTRFIVLSSNRGSPEKGVIAWTPYPTINSTAAEFAGSTLHIMTPARFPQGMRIPVVAWVQDAQGNPRRANGVVDAAGYEASRFQLRRGHGSGYLPPALAGGPIDYGARLPGVGTNKAILVDTNTTWINVSGVLAADTVWPANARMHVTAHLTVPAGGSLTVEPGAIIRLNPLVNITNNGLVRIQGTTEEPVVFTSTNTVAVEQNTYAWGGFIMRGAGSVIEAQGAIFTGGGGASSFSFSPGASHRSEQAVFLIHSGARAALTNCAVIDTAGQVANGYNSDVTYDHCLMQRAITCGEYVGGTVIINHSAIIEFPEENGSVSAEIADADYDGIYFTTGTHILLNSLFGFAKDDAIDSGSGGAGSMWVSNCWVESALHEALAWSGGGRVTHTYDTVLINSGQGIECGWSTGSDSPLCYASNLLSIANAIGARHGDNYDWTYNGLLNVSNSFILYNYRDIFGRNWADWTYRVGQMDLHDNFVTSLNTNHPANQLWNPAVDGARLAAFMSTPADAPVGVGLAVWTNQAALASMTDRVPVRLSSFTTHPVAVNYSVQTPGGERRGTLSFAAGETVKEIPLNPAALIGAPAVRVHLLSATGGEITGTSNLWYLPLGGNAEPPLVPLGAVWKYLDNGSDQGTAWRNSTFNDASWASGPAELGYGEGDEATVLAFGTNSNKHITYYFRHRFVAPTGSGLTNLLIRLKRDDGAIVYLNGQEVFRSNIPAGAVTFSTRANNAGDDGKNFYTQNVAPALLIAGTNLLAVEVHQDSPSSSDVSFDLELLGERSPAPPQLEALGFGDALLLFWGAAGFQLEEAPSILGPWQVVDRPSPAAIDTTGQSRFYRLHKP